MNNTKANSFNKFCVGAIFLIIGVSWNFINIIDNLDSVDSSFFELASILGILSNLITIGAIVTFCIFAFMKKNGLPLAISSFAVAFSALVSIISNAVWWTAVDDYNRYMYYYYDYYDYYGYYGYSVSDQVAVLRIITVLSLLMLLVTFAAIGVSALVSKCRGAVKAMKITSLVTGILFVVFDSVTFILNMATGYTSMILVLGFSNYIMYYIGVLLARGWCFKFISASTESENVADFDDENTDEDCIPAFEAEPAYTATAAPVAAPVSVAPAATVVAAPAATVAAPVAPSVSATPAAPAASAANAPAAHDVKIDELAIQLRTYKLLLDDGIITQEEFDAKKKEILASN